MLQVNISYVHEMCRCTHVATAGVTIEEVDLQVASTAHVLSVVGNIASMTIFVCSQEARASSSPGIIWQKIKPSAMLLGDSPVTDCYNCLHSVLYQRAPS